MVDLVTDVTGGAGEDVVLMAAGVVVLMLAVVMGDDGFWGKIIGLLLLALGLAWTYLGLA